MTDTPLMYGSYSKYMYPIIPDGEKKLHHFVKIKLIQKILKS